MQKKINVLLIDDSEKIISLLTEILSDIKNIRAIETTNNLREAEERINKKRPDVIVLDIQLPDGYGIEFLKWIKTKHPGIIVIMFSSFSEPPFRNAAKKFGADYFFDKSTEFEQVPKLISEIQ
jgi:DNA-binding NarL/FixJ family response regulator